MIGTCVPKAEKTCRVRTSKSLTYTTGTTSNTTYAACCYTGRRLDPETGLYYFRNRYYSADLGRFVSREPQEGWQITLESTGEVLTEFTVDETREIEEELGRKLFSIIPAMYVDGMNLYGAYFVPNAVDPLGLAKKDCMEKCTDAYKKCKAECLLECNPIKIILCIGACRYKLIYCKLNCLME